MVSLYLQDDWEPDPHSVEIMAAIDRMSKPMRALVREYGFKIVADMINDGYDDPFALVELLQTWRERRQHAWLETDFITARSARSIADAVQHRMTVKNEEAIWNGARL